MPNAGRIDDLRAFLARNGQGAVVDIRGLETILAACWTDLANSSETGMHRGKLKDRIEKPLWPPPLLTFWIVRHGETVQGSTRGTAQQWIVDTFACTALIGSTRRRQLEPMDARFDAKLAAKIVANEILCGQAHKHARLTVMGDHSVKVNVNKVVPETNKRTTADRRKRFRHKLKAILEPEGWIEVRPNYYRRASGEKLVG